MEIYIQNTWRCRALQYLLKQLKSSEPGQALKPSPPCFNHETSTTHSHVLSADWFSSHKVEQLRQDLRPKAAYASHLQASRVPRGRTSGYTTGGQEELKVSDTVGK